MQTKYSDQYRDIGRRISFYRGKAGLSQQELADRVGISKSYLSKIEAPGSGKPCSLEVLYDISKALGIEIINFFTESG